MNLMCFAEVTWYTCKIIVAVELEIIYKPFDFQGRNGAQYVQEQNFKSREQGQTINVFC